MKRKNMARNALFTSIISLLLCVSMLVGTTFAWFTDTVTSGNNVIASGNLDVEMYWADGKEDPASADWKDASEGAIFNYDLWEPGYTEVRHIKIANEGSLALKYQLKIQPNGEVSKLAEVIDVYYSDPAVQIADRAALAGKQPMGTLDGIVGSLARTASGKLDAGKSVVVTIALKMQESAGNEYQNLSIGTDFAVQLFATQVEAESDSFGQDYDKEAWHTQMQVANADDLQTAVNNAEPGTEIVLVDDVALDTPLVVPAAEASTYSLRSTPEGIALNLNGKKITSTVGRDAEGNRVHTIVNNGNLVIMNGTVASEVANGGSAVYNAAGATLVLEKSVTILGAPFAEGAWPSYGINNYGNLTVNGATIKTYHGGIATNGDGVTVVNDATIDVGQSTTTKQTSWCLYTYENGSLTVYGGTFENTKNENNKVYGGGYICPTSNGNTVIYGGTFNKTEADNNGTGIYYKPTNLTICGGTFDTDPSAYLDPDYKAVKLSDGKYVAVKKNAVVSSENLIDAINAGENRIELVPGDYALRFTNNTAFNLDDVTIVGMDGVNLAISSSEVWYGRIQGEGVTFENIHFTSSVGATGTATYKNCVFKDWAICASSGAKETYFNNCDIKGTLNTSTDFNSGDIYVNNCSVAKAEYSGTATMYFTDCQIGELISHDMATVLENCKVKKQDLKMENNKAEKMATDKSGVTYTTNLVDESVTLYNTAGYPGDTLEVPEGVDAIGNYAFSYNNTIETVVLPSSVTDLGRGFDSSTVKKVVLNEGLKSISSRAFKSTTALEEVEISSTVTEIADNAFQKSGIKEIVIPANVKTIGETAFGSSQIETVTFEGDIDIQGYAFRGCPNLKTVNLNGENVTFIASTLNGRNSTWFCNGESNNPNTSNITFHVVNETVAARVKVAMGAEAGNTPVYVNGKLYKG